MNVTLLSGVVRNRKQMATSASRAAALFENTSTDNEGGVPAAEQHPWQRLRAYFSKNNVCRKLSLRGHKFIFQWDLVLHLMVCLLSLLPFFVTGKRSYSCLPIGIWLFYNVLFIVSPKHSSLVLPRFGQFRHSFNATIEDFFSPKLLPVLSISFLCVVLTLAVTGHRLGGAPLCYQSCSRCLARWSNGVPLTDRMKEALSNSANIVHNTGTVVTFAYNSLGTAHGVTSGAASAATSIAGAAGLDSLGSVNAAAVPHIRHLLDGLSSGSLTGAAAAAAAASVGTGSRAESIGAGVAGAGGDTFSVDQYRIGCGYANGKEMLGYYTMAQTSFLLFLVVVVAMTVCLAWKIDDQEIKECRDAEDWLKRDNPAAFDLRQQLIDKIGSPASSTVRPEGSPVWVFFGVIAALTFTLLGWHNWYVLPPSPTATLLIVLNLLTIGMSTLILHVSFFGRLLALYRRNFLRVQYLTTLLQRCKVADLDSWWNCRNFVLNDDLSVDYDMGGLGVSATFLISIIIFIIFLTQVYREGLPSLLEAPGSYCAYACMYLTCCLIKLFTIATHTFEEQHEHIKGLQTLSTSLSAHQAHSSGGGGGRGMGQIGSASMDGYSPKEGNSLAPGGRGGAGERVSGRERAGSVDWIVDDNDLSQLYDDGPILIDDDEEQHHQHHQQPLQAPQAGNHGDAILSIQQWSNLVDAHAATGASAAPSGGVGLVGPAAPNIAHVQVLEGRSPSSPKPSSKGRKGSAIKPSFPSSPSSPSRRTGGGAGGGVGGGTEGGGGAFQFGCSGDTGSGDGASISLQGKHLEGDRRRDKSGNGDQEATFPSTAAATTGAADEEACANNNEANSQRDENESTDILVDADEEKNNFFNSFFSRAFFPAVPKTASASIIASRIKSTSADPADHISGGGSGSSGVVMVGGAGGGEHEHSTLTMVTKLSSSKAGFAAANTASSLSPVSSSVFAGRLAGPHDPIHLAAAEATGAAGTGGVVISAASVGTSNTHTSAAANAHLPLPAIALPPVLTSTSAPTSTAAATGPMSIPRPVLMRGESMATTEGRRQTIADMIEQIRRYDPYPCILGIPVMPALFSSCKFYIFICFILMGVRMMISCLRQL